MDYKKTYHPEFSGYVYQPNVPQITKWVEPFVTEKEAQAFIKGCQMMLDDKVAELEAKLKALEEDRDGLLAVLDERREHIARLEGEDDE